MEAFVHKMHGPAVLDTNKALVSFKYKLASLDEKKTIKKLIDDYDNTIEQFLLLSVESFKNEQTRTDDEVKKFKENKKKSLLKRFQKNQNFLDTLKSKEETLKSILAYGKFLNRLIQEERNQKKLTGSAGLGFYSDDSESNLLNRINNSFSIKRGSYPSELDVSSTIVIQNNNGTLAENLSLQQITYDYNLAKNIESFVFLDRFSNQFLGIDQRYEIGGGVLFDFFDGESNLTKKGKSLLASLINVNGIKNQHWFKQITPKDKLNEAETTLRKTRDRNHRSILKEYKKIRFAVLFGIFHEFETAKINRIISVPINDTISIDRSVTANVPTISTWRWEVRPTFDVRFNDEVKLKLRPYFKFPFGPWQKELQVFNEETMEIDTKERADIRLNLQAELAISSDPVQAKITYRYFKDYLPPFGIADEAGSRFDRLINADSFNHNVTFTFGIKFN